MHHSQHQLKIFAPFRSLLPSILLLLAGWPGLAAATPSPAARVDSVPGNPLSVQFTVEDSVEGMVHTWFFGDGTSAVGEQVTHVYAWPGNFFVTLETNNGGVTSSESLWVVAGHQAESLDFEEGLPVEEWMTNGLNASPAGRIEGQLGHYHSIVNPNPSPSCAMPFETPPDMVPKEPHPRRWVLSSLIDLTETPLVDGAEFEAARIVDDSQETPIFGVRLFVVSEKWHVTAYAFDSGLPAMAETQPRPVDATTVLVELEAQLGVAGLASGTLRLRASNWLTGQEYLSESLAGLDNASRNFDAFDFGLMEPYFPGVLTPGEEGGLKLDSFKVLTDSCLPPPSEDLVGYWDFENDSQIGADSSAKNRHGQLMGTASSAPGRPRPDGSVEQALELDGAGFLQIPNLGLDLVGEAELTLEAWVKVAAHSQTNLFRARQPFGVRSNGIAASNYVDDTGWQLLLTAAAPPVDQWYHLAAVFDNGKMSVYIDGQLAATKTVAFSALDGTAYADWALGARVPGGSSLADQFFTGQIDDVKIYTRVLGEGEIRQAAGLCD